MKKDKHLLLIDGMALLFRSFYATAVTGQFMINSKGTPTNAIQGLMKHLLTAVDKIQPTHTAVCWDMGSATFRNELYTEYKANREAPPVEMIPQFDLAKEVVGAFRFPNIGLVGYEADDCIGTIAKKVQDAKITILTGDKDLLQLLDNNIDVLILQKGFGNYKWYTHEVFEEEKGITPEQFIDVKALMGDPSDGYPGVKGIGEKTAMKLIQEFEHIEGIIENIQQLTPGQKKKLEADMEMLHLSRQLAKIHCEVPLEFTLEQAIWKEIPDDGHEMIETLELKALRRFIVQNQGFNNQKVIDF
ncbi:5'-3' exonuclease [Falsibacillus albus]|uniref:5'-3' exonuclease n=1 Tax=Falsibacillus albus TaxID=2478915 RepID=A0A3L7JWC2_9BACI|nr:5'-3' exonuclease [Falsibacillus albus]RLQ95158.1 5'-3' exonuclease [Falsibacillus albus]